MDGLAVVEGFAGGGGGGCAESSEAGRIGVYTIERVRSAAAECCIYTGGGLIDQVGFAYLPEGPPPQRRASETTYRHYDGSWYRFVVSM